MKEYIEREALFRFLTEQKDKETGAYSKGRNAGLDVARSALHNREIIPAADVVERKSSDTGETESKPHKWLRGEAALAKAILGMIPGAYALCRHTDGHPYLDSAWGCLDTILVLIHGEESQTLFSPHYFPSLRPNEQVALEYIINNADMRSHHDSLCDHTEEVEHEV